MAQVSILLVAFIFSAALFESMLRNAPSPTPMPVLGSASSPVFAPSLESNFGPAPSPGLDCFTILLNLSDCLTYVQLGSNLTKPNKPCCPELASLVQSSLFCLCKLLGNPKSTGFKININRALKLPFVCAVSTPPVSLCSGTLCIAPPKSYSPCLRVLLCCSSELFFNPLWTQMTILILVTATVTMKITLQFFPLSIPSPNPSFIPPMASQAAHRLHSHFTSLPLPSRRPRYERSAPRSLTITASRNPPISGRKLRVAVIGSGPAGSSAAESLASGGIETFLFERSPTAAKPCGGAIPLCMLDEFSIPLQLVDRHVTEMRIISPSNLTVDFGKTLQPGEFIAMVRREVLDSFLRSRAESSGASLITGLVTNLEVPTSDSAPYVVHYTSNSSQRTLTVDVVVGADGANSRVAKSIKAGDYSCAIAFQERIRLPDEKMEYYENLAEMYLGNDVSPDFYAWVFPKCDHVAVGTGTVCSKPDIKALQRGIRERVRPKIAGGKVIKVEAHPIPEHPRPVRVRGRVALVGDAAGYVTKCSGEGIYFAAKSGRMCGEAIVKASEGGTRAVMEGDLRREYLREWDARYLSTYRLLDLLQSVFYRSNPTREALVELCGDEYVQRMSLDSYMYKRLAAGNRWEDVKMAVNTVGSLLRCQIMGRHMDALKA